MTEAADNWETLAQDAEDKLLAVKNHAEQEFYMEFQEAAAFIAEAYRDPHQGWTNSNWSHFQNTAAAVGKLYRGGMNRLKDCMELAQQAGRIKATKELITWVRKNKACISREELLAHLSGKPAPSASSRSKRHSPLRKRHRSRGQSPPLHRGGHAHSYGVGHTFSHSLPPAGSVDSDLSVFHQAVALQALDSAMSSISVGHQGHDASPPANNPFMGGQGGHRKRSSVQTQSPGGVYDYDLSSTKRPRHL